MHSILHFVTHHGFYEALINWTIGALMGWGVRTLLKDNWEAFMREQRKIADRLDTSTPGGLGEVIAQVQGRRDSDDAAEAREQARDEEPPAHAS